MPSNINVSVFRQVAIGMVGSNRAPGLGITAEGKGMIEVIPTEWLSYHDGELVANPVQVEHDTKNIDGTADKGGFIADQTIKAYWLPEGTNRLSPPDVRRGERVSIWQVADDDKKFYWKILGLDDNLRKLETVIIGISNTQDEGDTELRPENMYWMEWSTHSKRLAISTSKSDGEPYLYEIMIETKKGSVKINDDIGNFINLVSKDHLLHLQNTDGTFFKLDKKDIKAYAPKNIFAKALQDIEIEAGRNARVKAGNVLTLDGGGSTIVARAGNITQTSATIDFRKG